MWPSMKFPPINLWTAPTLRQVVYKEKIIQGKRVYCAEIKLNPIYQLRTRN